MICGTHRRRDGRRSSRWSRGLFPAERTEIAGSMSTRTVFYILGSIALFGYLWTLGGVFRALGGIVVAVVAGLEIRGLWAYRQEQKADEAKIQVDAETIRRQQAQDD